MNRKRIGIILIVFGSLLALTVGAIVYTQSEQAAEIARRTPSVEVVIALTDLPDRVAIPPSAVAIVKVPADVAPLEAAVNLKDVVGKYPLYRVYKSEVVLLPKLADSAGKTGPSFTLKEGMVAITLSTSDATTGSGAIRQGDRVDMLVSLPVTRATIGGQPAPTNPLVSQTMLQNLEVMRVGAFPGADGGGPSMGGKGITFQVDHQDALIIKWAKDAGGQIDLVLRHPSDQEPVDTEAVNINYVIRKFRFIPPEAIQ